MRRALDVGVLALLVLCGGWLVASAGVNLARPAVREAAPVVREVDRSVPFSLTLPDCGDAVADAACVTVDGPGDEVWLIEGDSRDRVWVSSRVGDLWRVTVLV